MAEAQVLQGTKIEPGIYEIDPAHSSITAVARHLVFTKVRGTFGDFSGTITIADPIEDSKVEAVIQASTIDTRQPQRDEHLRSGDFLDVEKFPTIEFRTTKIESRSDDRFAVHGDLTIRGVSSPVVIDATFLGPQIDPWGNKRIIFEGKTSITREDFGITWNQALETGGVLVSSKLEIELEVQATPRS
jgi:polyisoprenoid-binding protein YceI